MARLRNRSKQIKPVTTSTSSINKKGSITSTDDIIIQLFTKCQADPKFFISNFCVFPDNPFQKMHTLSKKQEMIIDAFINNHFVIVNSSRQVGKTTLVEALILWLLMFHPYYCASVLSRSSDHAQKIIAEIQTIYDNLPSVFRNIVKQVVDNARSKEFSNGSQLLGIVVEKDKPENAARGFRAGFIFIDEAAFIQYADRVYTSLLPILTNKHEQYKKKHYPTGMIVASTPNGTEGLGRWFYTMWIAATNKQSNMIPIEYHWSDAPHITQDMIETLRSTMEAVDHIQFLQEYELLFTASSRSFLPSNIVVQLQQAKYTPLVTKYYGPGGKLTTDVYKPVHESSVYLLGVDTAGESGFSNQCICIMEYTKDSGTNMVKAIGATYGKIPIIDFAGCIIKICEEILAGAPYILFIERNYLGEAVIDYIRKHSPQVFRNIFVTYERNSNTQEVKKVVKGIKTTSKTRDLMFDSLNQYLSDTGDDKIAECIMPEILRRQLITLEYSRTGKITVPLGSKDDMVMAMLMVLYSMYYCRSDFMKQTSNRMIHQYQQNVDNILALTRMRYNV